MYHLRLSAPCSRIATTSVHKIKVFSQAVTEPARSRYVYSNWALHVKRKL